MKVAVVGAGWAGLAAAVCAADLGHDVTVLEASHTLGGRARAVQSRRLGLRIDNGQHILLGAYTEALALMERLEIDLDYALLQETLRLESADGSFRLQVARLPAPWHVLGGLLTAKGLTLGEKWRLGASLHRLRSASWQTGATLSVEGWLDAQRQSARSRELFWRPLCLAALNTPLHRASAQLFANVLRDSLGRKASACNVLLPRVDLSALWADRVEYMTPHHPQGRLAIQRGAVVRKLDFADSGGTATARIRVHGQTFDALILACNTPSAHRLLATLPFGPKNSREHSDRCALIAALAAFQHIPIATVTLRLEQPWALPRAMYMLAENREAGHFGQWLFNCPAFMHVDSCGTRAPALAHVVISDAADALQLGDTALAEAVCAQLAHQTRRFGPMPSVSGYELIAEKRATFEASPGLARPTASTPWPGIWLAGDWTDTGYPGVLEGAIRSGRQAAHAVHEACRPHETGFNGPR